jgi:hypothetical protein
MAFGGGAPDPANRLPNLPENKVSGTSGKVSGDMA